MSVIPIDRLAERGRHPQECPARHRVYDLSDCTCTPCGNSLHADDCLCPSSGEVELREDVISFEQDGFTIEVEVIGR